MAKEQAKQEFNQLLNDDENFAYVAAWEFDGVDKDPILHKEDLVYENVELAQRSYK